MKSLWRPITGYGSAAAISLGRLALLVSVLIFGTSARADPDFFRGKTISIVVGTGEGGPYSLSALLLSRHWPRHIPGQPAMIVQSMPGAGGIRMANWLDAVAPKDGTVIGMPVQTVALAQMIEPGVRFDARRWNWIGNLAVLRQVVVASRSAPAVTMAAAQSTELVVGATQRSGNLFIVPKLARELAGAKFKIVLGYKGANDLDKAMAGGELQGRGGSWSDLRVLYPRWKEGEGIAPLVMTGMTRDTTAPDVPLLREFAADAIDRQVIDFFGQTDQLGRVFAAPPGTPQPIVDLLRTSFMETMKDEAFIEELRKRDWPFEPEDFRAVAKAVAGMIDVAPAVPQKMKEVLDRP